MNRRIAILLFMGLCLNACASSTPTDVAAASEAEVMIETELSPGDSAESGEAQVIRGLGYRPDAFFENQLDLYVPADNAQDAHPAVLLLHGGGEDKHDMEDLATRLVEAGYAVAAANFRSMGGGEYPGTVEDAFCALAWMVNASESYDLDSDRVYAVGFSLGGTLASMLAVVDQPDIFLGDCAYTLPTEFRLRGAVVFTGIFDYASAALVNEAMGDYVEGYLGGTIEAEPDVWEQASAINWVDGSEPPFLLLHGETDENIPPQQTLDFEARLLEAGTPVEKIIVPGVEHFGLIADPSALEAMFTFLAD